MQCEVLLIYLTVPLLLYTTTGFGMGTISQWNNDTNIIGEDPRFLSIDERRFRVYYTYPAPFWDVARMGMLELTYNDSSRRLDVTALRQKIEPTYPKNSNTHKDSHKNWSPFLFRGHPLLIQSINPLVVVNETDESLVAEVVSISKLTRMKWPFGSLRGGTNCILVNDSYYLSFFHSKAHIDNSYMSTYVMGAYTFSKTIPFQLQSISAYPIMHPRFYTGEWSFQKMARIDFILFPTSLYLVDGDTLVVTAGMQDLRGVQFRINIFELLATLVRLR